MNPIVNQFKLFVDFLGSVLGDNCEIVLIDLTSDKNGICAIANGSVSGRNIDSPITNLAQSIINNEEWKEKDFVVNYKGINKSNKVLRSSTFFIKDNDMLVGMLCINIDDNKYIELSNKILALGGVIAPAEIQLSNNETKIETFAENIEDSIDHYIAQTELANVPGERLTQDEKTSIVEMLYNKGIFHVKGAVFAVSCRLHCSEATVYRYLSKIQKNIS